MSFDPDERDRVFDDADSPELTRAKNEFLTASGTRRWMSDVVLEAAAAEGCVTIEDFEKKIAEAKAHERIGKIKSVADDMRNEGFPQRHLTTITRAIVDGSELVTDAMVKARAFIEDKDRCLLVLSGGTGVGKTHAATALPFELDLAGQLGYGGTMGNKRFVEAVGLAKLAGFDHEKEWRHLEGVGLLVIDDYGAEFADGKGWLCAAFDGLINHRYANCKLTVITTNLDAATFKTRAGERIADRIVEAGRFVVLGGESLRRKRDGR